MNLKPELKRFSFEEFVLYLYQHQQESWIAPIAEISELLQMQRPSTKGNNKSQMAWIMGYNHLLSHTPLGTKIKGETIFSMLKNEGYIPTMYGETGYATRVA